jgi:hypothetical protein
MDHEPTSHKKPVFPSFSSDDIKLLIITFAGTLAANILTVVFVGLALAIVHAFRFTPSLYRIYFLAVATFVSIILPLFILTPITSESRNIRIIVAAGAISMVLFCILLWVGLAAGIK